MLLRAECECGATFILDWPTNATFDLNAMVDVFLGWENAHENCNKRLDDPINWAIL